MKIAILSHKWFTETKGGAERYIYELTKGLAAMGNEVVTVSRQASDLPNDHIKVWSPGITMVGSALFGYLGARRIGGGGFDVVVVNQYWAETASLYLDTPVVLILHDVGLFESEIAQRAWVRHYFRRRILERVVERAETIVVPSSLTSDDLMEHLDVPPEKIVKIPEGVDLELYRPGERRSLVRRILCTGRFSPNKGHRLLIEAVGELRSRTGWQGELLLVGHVPPRERGYFEEIVSSADENVKIVTEVSDEEMAGFYREADICVFPSVSDEGWGLTVVEAFASGVPVVCSDIFVETGVADEDRAIVVPRGEVGSLVDAMERLIYSAKLREELASRGLEFAQGLSWGRMAERIGEVIQGVIEGG